MSRELTQALAAAESASSLFQADVLQPYDPAATKITRANVYIDCYEKAGRIQKLFTWIDAEFQNEGQEPSTTRFSSYKRIKHFFGSDGLAGHFYEVRQGSPIETPEFSNPSEQTHYNRQGILEKKKPKSRLYPLHFGSCNFYPATAPLYFETALCAKDLDINCFGILRGSDDDIEYASDEHSFGVEYYSTRLYLYGNLDLAQKALADGRLLAKPRELDASGHFHDIRNKILRSTNNLETIGLVDLLLYHVSQNHAISEIEKNRIIATIMMLLLQTKDQELRLSIYDRMRRQENRNGFLEYYQKTLSPALKQLHLLAKENSEEEVAISNLRLALGDIKIS